MGDTVGGADENEGRDVEAVGQFVERFAAVLVEAGFPRMPARVFVALLVTDSGRLTSAELADQLKVSPAAVSGAVRYLSQVDMVTRGHEPGSRRDHYQLLDDVWYEASVRKDQMYRRWSELMREGMVVLGPDTPAGQRVDDTRAFFEFLQDEMPLLVKRWREYRTARLGAGS
jgi:DNA-binding transcriptional regulator GbsR (MarR family)